MARTTINTQVIPDGTIVSADLSYPLTDFSSTGIDDNATSNALTIDSSQDVTFSSHALFPDNSRARFGAGLDLQIYHDGSNSYIDESSGVGNLIVKGANVLLQNTTGENYLTLTTNGAATLYYDNAAKLATTSTGIDVTGDVNSDSVTTGTFTSTGIDDNATSTAITIDSSENVGIGTTNPSSDAIVKFLAIDDATSSGLVLEGARKFSMYSSSSSTLSFRDETAGANRITLDSSGNVGIGTATPNSAGLGYNGQTLQLGERTFIATDSSGDTRLGGLSGSNITAFYQGGSERMRIDSSGSLVIGATTSNNRKLSVNGTGDLVELRSTNSGAAGAQLDLIHNSASPADGDSVGIINFSNVTTQMANVTGKSSSVSSSYGELHFGTRNGGTYGFSNMIIDRLGNLLVGKASTDYGNSTRKEFNLYGTNEAIITLDTGNALPFYLNNNNGGADIWNQNNNYMRFGTNSTERMRIDSSGKVGVGITNPSGSFHLTTVDSGGSDVYYVAQNTTANRIAGYRILDESNNIGGVFQYDNGGNNLLIGTTLSSNFQFITNNAERMRINTDGSIAFSPNAGTVGQAALSINASGSSYAELDAFMWGIGWNMPLVLQRQAGNVGIGTISPSEKLHVSGNIRAGVSVTSFQNGSANDNYIGVGSDNGGDAWFIAHASGYGVALMGYESAGDRLLIGCDNGAGNNKIDFSLNMGTNAAGTVENTTGATPAVRITASGTLLVGKTADTNIGQGQVLRANGETYHTITTGLNTLHVYSVSGSAYRFYVGNDGTVHATNTSISAISDASLKENIRDLDKGLDTINALKPRRFDWKNGDGNDIMGFIAQEVEEVMPELIDEAQYNKDEIKKSLKMGDMIPSMVKAIQELSAQVTELKAEVAALKGA